MLIRTDLPAPLVGDTPPLLLPLLPATSPDILEVPTAEALRAPTLLLRSAVVLREPELLTLAPRISVLLMLLPCMPLLLLLLLRDDCSKVT
jgi:hypothetical protein